MPVDMSWSCNSGAQLHRWHISESHSDLLQMYNQSWGTAADTEITAQASAHKLAARNLIAKAFPNHELAFTAHGKPVLFPNSAHINHSHAGDYALFIQHPNRPVGVDIEQLRPQLKKIYPRFCNPEELSWLGADPHLQTLLLIWCAKEAMYKAIGEKGTDFRESLSISPIAENTVHPSALPGLTTSQDLTPRGLVPQDLMQQGLISQDLTQQGLISQNLLPQSLVPPQGTMHGQISLSQMQRPCVLNYQIWGNYTAVWVVL